MDKQEAALLDDLCRLPRAEQMAIIRLIRRVADAKRAGKPVSIVEAARETGDPRLIAAAETAAQN